MNRKSPRRSKSRRRRSKSRRRRSPYRGGSGAEQVERSDSYEAICPGVPEEFVGIAEDCAKNAEWVKQTKIGEGDYGEAWLACKEGCCEYVLKEQLDNEGFRIEVKALHELQGPEHAVPILYAAWTCNGRGYFIIEKLSECVISEEPHTVPFAHTRAEVYDRVNELLGHLYEKDWVHVDVSGDNVMCDSAGNPVLIDFGWAVKKTDGESREDGQMYFPNHPLSKQVDFALTWEQLLIIQRNNVEQFYGVPGSPSYIDAVKEVEKV